MQAKKGNSSTVPTFEVAVAILCFGGKIWIQKRTQTNHLDGYWEFPGGKIVPGETPAGALRREVSEEVGIELPPDGPQLLLVQEYAYPERKLRIHYFTCRLNTVVSLERGQWVSPVDLPLFALPPANLEILGRIIRRLS